MLDFLMDNYKTVMLIIILTQIVVVTLALIFATPIGVWLCLELSLTITSGFLQFVIGLLFLWLMGSIALSILGIILTLIMWFTVWKEI